MRLFVGLELMLARTDELALFVHSGRAYSHGFEFTFGLRTRKARERRGDDDRPGSSEKRIHRRAQEPELQQGDDRDDRQDAVDDRELLPPREPASHDRTSTPVA